ncbi:malic enzyme-like NAD(P)-binding protein [Ruminococcus sp. FC2018]|uniref:NAD(P)-dependent malic enzyme n=1 Tax=Ruminococcus sp. FC2018 TaxID=1410617 RepID=UPI00048B1FCE|nr:malic enzyme-like NAD(P)-binding protein [Ruminococcus sp. FC2018]
MDVMEKSLEMHRKWEGKIEVISRTKINNAEDLTLAYTPGVARPCLEIQKDPDLSYELTRRANLVAVITDGSAVLGLGNIGGLAGMPVMEGKCALFKEFADVDAFPLCINSNDVDEIVNTIALIGDSFGGINLEDIAAPRCFEIEAKLKEKLDIPVFHDDQHGTAIVVGAALMNACKVAGKKISDITIVINGAGAAGCAIGKLILSLGVGNLIMVDREGIICEGDKMLNQAHEELSKVTNKNHIRGSLADAMRGADAFIGVSKPDLVSEEMVRSMADKPIIFAMANPVPEIMPDKAKQAGAFIVGTGRSDFPNQINNVVAFPGIFKGALAVRARDINEEMKMAAAKAIAGCVSEDQLCAEFILPNAFDRKVPVAVAEAVARAARETGVAKI